MGYLEPEVIAIGETMLMLVPPPNELLEQVDNWRVLLAGAEANVLIGLERLGMRTAWISKLTRNALGNKIVNDTRRYGVNTSRVIWTEEGRIGLLFCETGVPPRPYFSIYDRANTAISSLKIQELDWEFIKQAKVVHMTGITPALSPICLETTTQILRRCQEEGILTSFDVNYRSLLWTPSVAKTTLNEILPYVDLLFVAHRDVEEILIGHHIAPETALRKLQQQYNNQVVTITLADKGAIALEEDIEQVQGYPVTIVNRMGAGDAFVSGFLYGYLTKNLKTGLQYGTALAALKHTIPQNVPLITKKQVERLISNQSKDIIR